jgi:hypothetical protein
MTPVTLSFSLFIHKATVFDFPEFTNTENQTISISASEFSALNWTDEHEFIYKGAHYDLYSINKKGNRYLLSCLSDKKEDQLLSKLDNAIGGKRGLKKITYRIITFTPAPETRLISFHLTKVIQQKKLLVIWNDAPKSITTPPPRFMS